MRDDVTVEFEVTGAHKDLFNDTIVATAFIWLTPLSYQKTAVAISFSTNTAMMLSLLYVILNLCISGKLSYVFVFL